MCLVCNISQKKNQASFRETHGWVSIIVVVNSTVLQMTHF